MDEQTMELFGHLNDALTTLADLQIIDMLASDKYTVTVKAVLVTMLTGIHGGYLPISLDEITGKDETEFHEMMMSIYGNNGGNGGGSGPVNPGNPT